MIYKLLENTPGEALNGTTAVHTVLHTKRCFYFTRTRC